ncbi:MAG TPA: chorismate-binding protein [Thermoanaerobaculia bacterium]|nr:chorismate-binding protein [Thermoanaerobaculia bacterium]
MHHDFAFIQTSPGRLFAGWGPFEALPFRRPGRPAFFATDFFLDDARPWLHPARWDEITVGELAAMFEQAPVEAEWSPPPDEAFQALFRSAAEGIDRGDFKKIVPVVFEEGRLTRSLAPWRYFLSRLEPLPRGLWAYGWSNRGRASIGATPEVLFQTHGRGYKTMALAGTRPMMRSDELLRSPKEMREHRLVVDDIARRLAPFGNVEIGALGIMTLPGIAHLITPIFFMENGIEPMTFADMVRRLHPTAALGVSPRSEKGERWLRESDRLVDRRTFGAPFGLERDDAFALALVGIRNVEWEGDLLRIGSGAGLISDSVLEQEIEELWQKRDQVKALFGLRAPVEAYI